MDNLIYILFVSIFIPILLMALLVNKKARFPIIFVLAGIFISVFASEVNGFIRTLSSYEINRFVILITPITEEILKSLPIFYLALLITDKREKLFTASMATGIGFAILENAVRYLKKGGTLVYSTCTLLPEENEQNVRRLLEECPFMEACDFKVGNAVSENGMLTLLPSVHGTDGFFIAKLVRKENE